MAKNPPRPGDFRDDFITTDDLVMLEEIVTIYSGPAVYFGDEPPQSMGARLSFRDWDWMIRTLGPS